MRLLAVSLVVVSCCLALALTFQARTTGTPKPS